MTIKYIVNTVIWFFASLLYQVIATDFHLEIRVPFPIGQYILIVFWLALAGAVVQGIFISEDNFKLTPGLSIVRIGTLVMTVFLLFLAMSLNAEIQFLFRVILIYAIPIYLITTISYYATR